MKIKFTKMNLSEFEANTQHSIMRNLQDNNIPIASSCGGEGICGKCKVTVVSGIENISLKLSQETELLNRLKIDEINRLSCQCFISGDVVIDAPYW